MTPNRPYLLRALFDWICDNNCTPYLLVDATLEGVEVPLEHVAGGRIVLNASGTAVVNFEITDDAVSFSTRFSGRDTWIHVPMAAVLAIYAKETQEGMTFAPADYPDRKQRAEFVGAEEEAGSQTGGGAEPAAATGATQGGAESTKRTNDDQPSEARSKNPKSPRTKPGAAKPDGSHLKVIK